MLKKPHVQFTSGASTLVIAMACLAMAAFSSAANAQELLGYWQLEETDVSMPAVDSSGNGLTGTYEGGVDPNVAGAPGFGSGAFFDGSTSQVLIDGGADVFGQLTNDFTVMAWINVDQFVHKNRIFGGFPVGGGWGFGTVGDQLEITTYGVKDYDQPVPLQLDTWTHVAVALDADNAAHFYADGEFVGTQTHGAPGNAIANDFFIGASCCSTEFFAGELDEIGVFRGTLNADQIRNAMNLGVSNFEGAPPGEPGDFNLDGVVDAADFAIMAENFNARFPREESYSRGDFDLNTRVDLNDFLGFRELFNSQGAAAAAVPEPTTLSLATFVVFGLATARRRRRHEGDVRRLPAGSRLS